MKPQQSKLILDGATTQSWTAPTDCILTGALFTAETPANITLSIEVTIDGIDHIIGTGADSALQTVWLNASGKGLLIEKGTIVKFTASTSGDYRAVVQYEPVGA